MKTNTKRFFNLNPHRNDGFTLVELIVVIAILAILAAVAVPAYSGYIEKANRAGDENLLATINRAFSSACLENGINQYVDIADAKIQLDSDGKIGNASATTLSDDGTAATIHISGLKFKDGVTSDRAGLAQKLNDSFEMFYAGNENSAFKTVENYLPFDPATGLFKLPESGSTLNELFNSLKEKYGTAIAEKILTSSLGAIGTENLFDQMNGAMDLAGELNLHKLTGAPFMEAFLGYLGIDPDDYDDNDAAQVALDAKLESLGGIDEETAMTHAIALYAAQNSAGLTTDSLSKWLGGETTTEDLQNSANANTLAEAAAIYGMYMCYCKETTGAAPTGNTLDVLTEALTKKEFATWVGDSNGSAQSELDAYKTYMDIVNEAAKDESARDEILANGFTNPELEDLMKDLIGS